MLTIAGIGRRHRTVWSVAVVATVSAAVVAPASWSAASTSRGATAKATKAVPRVIIDTDLSRWWDDVTAVGLANVLNRRGEIRLVGIVSNVPNKIAVAAIDAIDTAYGQGNTPLGAVERSGTDTFQHGYTDVLVSKLPHRVKSSADVPEAVALYRRLLVKQPDHSVTIVSIGGFTNLAGLLASKRGQGSPLDGRALITKKVKRLVQMEGFFPAGGPPFTNQKLDLAAASAVVQGNWPTPIAWVDGQPGIAAQVGETLCTTVPANHPMRIVYEALFGCGPPRDGDWDAPAFLYAIGDIPNAFQELGQGGAAVINDKGGLSWQTPSTRQHDLYVHAADQATLNHRIDELLAAKAQRT
jgi:hypothetical protein